MGKKDLISILIIILVLLVVYANSLKNEFVYDDMNQILGNPYIKDIRNLPTIFEKPLWGYKEGKNIPDYYRPLMTLIFMADYYLFGSNPTGFHCTSLLLHIGVTILVFFVGREILITKGQRNPLSSTPLVAAILFAAHPIHTESVSWIAGVNDLLCTLFYLGAFYLYIKKSEVRGQKSKVKSLSIAILFLLALLSKEMAVTLPLILILYDYSFNTSGISLIKGTKEGRLTTYIMLFLVLTFYMLLRVYALGGLFPRASNFQVTYYSFIINLLPLLRDYILKLIFPIHLNAFYPFKPVSSFWDTKIWSSILLISIILIMINRKKRYLFFNIGWVIITLLPVLYIKDPRISVFAERYLYLPSVGYCMIIANISSRFSKNVLGKKIIISLIIAMICLLSFRTIIRNRDWENNIIFYSKILEFSPDLILFRFNLAHSYQDIGLIDKAIIKYNEVLKIDPNYLPANINLGSIYFERGSFKDAITSFKKAVSVDHNNFDAHLNLAISYHNIGLLDDAVMEYKETLKINPKYESIHSAIGAIYEYNGKYEDAIKEFQEELKIVPDDKDMRNKLLYLIKMKSDNDNKIKQGSIN